MESMTVSAKGKKPKLMFESVALLAAAIADGKVPNGVSPGGAAVVLGVTRQAVHQLLKTGTLRASRAPGVILVHADSINARLQMKGMGLGRFWKGRKAA